MSVKNKNYSKDTASNYNIVIGRRSVVELFESGLKVRKLFVQAGAKSETLAQAISAAEEQNVKVEYINKSIFEKRFYDMTHQGVAAEYEIPKTISLKDVIYNCEGNRDATILLLDGVEDPRNFGAIVRTAEALGIDAVIQRTRRATGITPTSVKSSSGALLHFPTVFATNLSQAITELQKANFWVYGLDSEAKKSIWDADLDGKCVFVLGNEGEGISRLVLDKCDFVLNIPLKGKTASLNVSIAAALTIGEKVRQMTITK